MKYIKLNFVLALALLFLFSRCSKDISFIIINDDKSIATPEGIWRVISYDDLANHKKILKTDSNTWNNRDVVITFKDTLSKTQLYGHTVFNDVGGDYIAYQRVLKVQNFGGTKVGEPIWGSMFWPAIEKSESYAVNSTQLQIFYNGRNNSITFQKQ